MKLIEILNKSDELRKYSSSVNNNSPVVDILVALFCISILAIIIYVIVKISRYAKKN